MSGLRHVFALLGPLLLVFVATTAIAARIRQPRPRALVASAAVSVAALVPVGGTSLASLLLGVFDTLSVTSVVLLALAVFGGRAPVHLVRHDRMLLAALLAAAALVLYPSALGFVGPDTYASGFGGFAFPIALGLVLAYSAYYGLILVPAVIAAALLGWLVGIGESRNLWDYLVDPVAVVMAVSMATRPPVELRH